MQLFLTHDGQTWDISPYVSAKFEDHTLRLFYKSDVETTLDASTAEIGESFIARVFGNAKTPILEKIEMPKNRGDKILWALSFAEPEKRVSSYDSFFELYPNTAIEYGSTCSIMHYSTENYAFLVVKKRPQPGKGHKTRQTKYKPCLAWCSDTISEESLQELIQKYRRYRKIYCPIDFLMAL